MVKRKKTNNGRQKLLRKPRWSNTNPTNPGLKLGFSGRVDISCYTCGILRVTPVNILVISHDRGRMPGL
jgi:hypothetical protein